MYIIILKFSENNAAASQFMDGHVSWLKQGFADNIFILSGSLQPNLGGGIFATNITREALEERVARDPFVKENIVTAEIIELTPSLANESLQYLIET
ncbi:MAG: YciI family protein [bacterium]